MSQSPSPFSLPDQTPPQRQGATRNTVAIVAIISLTLLLMCGGVIGLGIYAVDRLADDFAELIEEGEGWDEEGIEVALEYALEEDERVRQRVGEIESVTSRDDLTYDEDAGVDDYFYEVEGSDGNAVVVVQFHDEEQKWFKTVELVDGDQVGSPRSPIEARNAPFDTQWSREVFKALEAEDRAAAAKLNVGSVNWIEYDYEGSLDQDAAEELRFIVHGDSDTASLVVEFEDAKYTNVLAIHLVDALGNRQEQIYEANGVPESDSAPDTPEPTDLGSDEE